MPTPLLCDEAAMPFNMKNSKDRAKNILFRLNALCSIFAILDMYIE